MKTFEFIKLNQNDTISGKFVSFGKNFYGLFIVLGTKDGLKALSIENVVLKKLIKNNIQHFDDGVKVEITKLKKDKNKKYNLYTLKINDKLLTDSTTNLSKNDLLSLL